MTEKRPVQFFRRSRNWIVSGALLIPLALSGCGASLGPYDYNEKEHDYRKRHAITVESTVARNWINFRPGQAALTATDTNKLQRYFNDFIVAGHGHITARMATANISLAVRNNRIAALRQVAREQGVKQRELEILLTPELQTPKGRADLELGYIRYVAGLPDCPDWGKNVDDNSRNTDHSNFGCATQSNLGAMVVDPSDLIRPRKSRAADGATVDNAIRTVNVPRAHPKKGVGTVGAGAPVIPGAAGAGATPAPEGATTNQQSTTPTAAD